MTTSAVFETRRPWLVVARAAYLIVLALIVGVTFFDIPFQLVHDQTVCGGASCPSDQISPADAAQLQQAGLSLPFVAGYQVAVNTITVLVFALVGSLIFWRLSGDWFGIYTAMTLALTGFALTIGGPPSPALVAYYPAWQYPIQLLSSLGSRAVFAFFLLFPDGHFVPGWTRWLMALLIVDGLVTSLRPNLLGGNDWGVYPVAAAVVIAIIYRYRRVSNTVQRQQTRWVVFGSLVGLGGVVLIIAFSAIVPQGSVPAIAGFLINSTGWYLFLLLIPLSIGIAILRSHLWDIDILIRRTLIYGALTALLALVYLGAVVALQAVFTALTGQQRSELVTVISTLVIAALFVPLRNRIQAVIDRRFYRRKYDAARTLAQFGAALRDEVNLDDLSDHLLTAVDETMQPESVALWLVKQ